MARIIKFRGKAAAVEQPSSGKMHKAGEWVYGNLCGHPDRIEIEEVIPMSSKYWHMPSTIIDPNTVCQYTGLHDQNGKEIYECDIMGLPEQDANGVKYKNRYVRVVEWVNDGFFLVDNCMMGGEVRKYGDRLALEISLKSEYAGIARCFEERGLDYSVIGNIHDNPELLKKQED